VLYRHTVAGRSAKIPRRKTRTTTATATTAAAALPYYTSVNAQALLGKFHLITGHGDPERA